MAMGDDCELGDWGPPPPRRVFCPVNMYQKRAQHEFADRFIVVIDAPLPEV